MTKWAHIETAPKDGTYFLIWMSGAGGYAIGRWWSPPDGREPGWFGVRFESLEAWPGVSPKYWIALPSAPEEKE
jgi:hypothetical protein